MLLQTTLPKVLIANWAVWPAANYIAFRFIPADMRILYANCLGVRRLTLTLTLSLPRVAPFVLVHAITSLACQCAAFVDHECCERPPAGLRPST